MSKITLGLILLAVAFYLDSSATKSALSGVLRLSASTVRTVANQVSNLK